MSILVVILLVFVVAVPDAVAQRLPLRTFSSADGLAGDSIYSLLPDSRGFLWIATATGLSRFDGREFRNYGQADGLPHPSVRAIIEDRDGVIWVGTRGGLVRIEPQGHQMSRVPVSDVPSPDVVCLLQTGDGHVWVATDRGLYMFTDERHLAAPEHIALMPPSLPAAEFGSRWDIEVLAEGRDGDLWIGTTFGLIRRFRDGRLAPIRVRPTPRDDRVFQLAVDRDGRVWITHWGIAHAPSVNFGVYVLAPEPEPLATAPADAPAAHPPDGPTLHERAHRITASDRIPLPTHPGEAIYMTAGGPIGDARVQSVFAAQDGTIWISTENGIVRVDRESGGVTRYDERNGLGMPVKNMVADARGDLWLASRGLGLVRLEHDGFVTYGAREGVTSGEVASVIEDATGALCLTGTEADNRPWFATFAHDRFVTFRPRGTEQVQYWGWGWQQLLLHDHTGEWWLPTGDGLFRYPASASCASIATTMPKAVYKQKDGLPINEIFRLFEDSRGDLWMSVASSAVRWVRATGAFEVVSDHDSPTFFAEDRAGNVWIGFYHGGLARWRAGKLRLFDLRDGVPDGFVQALYVDSRGRLWIGAVPGGLARVDDPTADTPVFTPSAREDGVAGTGVFALVEDRQQRLYVASGRGMLRFDPALTHIRRFSTADGLASHTVRCAFAASDGRLWFGTHHGLSLLTPTPEAAPAPPPIYIDSLRVGGLPQRLSQLGSAHVDTLSVEPESRRIEIGYGSPNLTPGETPRYQVRLQGVDPDWGAATTDRTALYPNLAPGTYRFEARAVNASGLASSVPASVAFTILPPLWQRAWFQMLAALLIAAAVYAAYRSRVAHLLALERMRSRIATDLHDDLGARLSRISILSEVAARRVSTDATSAGRLLGEVGETARSLIEATADITWSVDPRQDDLASLTARIRRFAADMLEARDIGWTFDAPLDGASIKLSPEHRRHVLLVFQEAINNIVRHAQARHASLLLKVDDHHLHAEIADDGRGFDVMTPASPASVADVAGANGGRGLSNMATRARELGGDLKVTSETGRGTRVRLSVPLR